MENIVLILNVVLAVLLVGVILLQKSEGGALGIGVSQESFISSRSAGSFLTKATSILATLFIITSISLTVMSKDEFSSSSVLETIEEWKGETKKHQFEESVLIDISGTKIDFEEFKSIFYKNNPKDSVYDEAYILDYFSLFVKFKLKIQEAKELGYDTVRSFIDEFEGLG